MARLNLHVGMPKTGSTAIQATLARHGDLLASAGYVYPRMAVNHGNFLIPAFEPEGHSGASKRMREMLTEEAEVLVDRLADLVRQHPGASFIISGENFASMSEAGAVRLATFLRGLFESMRVIAFVRPPNSLVHSLAQEQIQNMGHGAEWLESARLYLPYKRSLEKWRNIAGEDFRAKVFARSALSHGCAVATLLDLAELPHECYESMLVEQSNQTLSMFAAELFCLSNELYPPRIDNEWNPARAKRLSVVIRRATGTGCQPFLAPEDFVSRSIHASSEEIRWVEELLGERLARFDKSPPSDAPRFSRASSIARREELSSLLRAMNDELLSAQSTLR